MRIPGISAKKITYYAWGIWFVASLFYAIEFLQRVSPSVMALPLMHYFKMGPERLSFVISLYFYAYALAQIPVGIMLDRYGARRLLTLACIVISVSSLLFAWSGSVIMLAFARIMIGFGSAFAFLGVLKLTSAWFPRRRYPLIVGLTNTLGVVGAILGEAPLAKLVQSCGWQKSMVILAVIGFVISLLVWFVIKDYPICLVPRQVRRPCLQPKSSNSQIMRYMRTVLTNSQVWLTALYAGGMVAPVIALGELWAVPFITGHYHFSAVTSASIDSALFIGIAVGGPVNGFIIAYFKNFKRLMQVETLIVLLSLCLFIFGRHFNAYTLFTILFVTGFATSIMLLSFTINKARFSTEHSATIAAFTNIVIVLCGSFFQDVLGYFLHRFDKVGNIDYPAAFAMMPVISLVCFILLFFIRIPDITQQR